MGFTVHYPSLVARRQQGMILLFALGCFCIISYFVLLQCERILLQQRYLNSFVRKQRTLEHMEIFARNLIKQPIGQWPSECIRAATDEPLKKQGELSCVATYKKTPLQYLIEQLPIQACLQMRKDNKHYSSQLWWLTIVQSDKLTAHSNSYLQIYFMTPSLLQDCLNQQIIDVIPGISSWKIGALGEAKRLPHDTDIMRNQKTLRE